MKKYLLFAQESTEEEKEAFFGNILPKIISLALRLPELVAAPIPLLKQGQNRLVKWKIHNIITSC